MSKINVVHAFGHAYNQSCQQNDHIKHPIVLMIISNMYQAQRQLAKALEQTIPEMTQGHGAKLEVLLQGSDTTFERAKSKFLIQIGNHLRAFLAKVNCHEEIARRNKEMYDSVSQFQKSLGQ